MKHKPGKSVKARKTVKFKFKTKLDVSSLKPVRKKSVKRAVQYEQSSGDEAKTSDLLLVTGDGVGVSVCDGEQVVSWYLLELLFRSDSTLPHCQYKCQIVIFGKRHPVLKKFTLDVLQHCITSLVISFIGIAILDAS